MAQGPSDTILVAIRITSPKSEILFLRIGGGLCSLSTSSFFYSRLYFVNFTSHFVLYCFYLRTSVAFINKIIVIVIVI